MMNDNFTNDERDETIAQKLWRVAEQTNASSLFAAELEEKLRTAHQPKTSRFTTMFRQVSPTLRWVALLALLALVLSLSIKTLIPAPQPAINASPTFPALSTSTPEPDVTPDQTPTSAANQAGYDFRGAKLFLQGSLPQAPAPAQVYLQNRTDEQATQEQARALADRFGIQGEMYTAPGLVYGTTDYLISDGKQSLQVHSNYYFSYESDMARNHRGFPKPSNPDAETIIREFLTGRGFDFPFRVVSSESAGGYLVQPLAPDSIPMQYESYSQPMMRVVLDENGQILTVDATLMNYDPTPVGQYGIITAQEAFEMLLNDSIVTGKMEYVHSADRTPQEWYREYPDNQPVTVYGYLASRPALDPSRPALILLDGIPAIGNTSGMENLDDFAYVQAQGQYVLENGIRRLNVQSWDRQVNEAYVSGTLHRQGDQIVITSDDGTGQQYPLIDPPADVPLETKVPDSQLAVSGVIVNGKMFWTYVQYFDSFGGGGGGGGGGLGFYKLNLSGTPVAFPPSPVPQPAPTNVLTSAYIIQEGDTLSAIAQKVGTTVDALVQLNGLADTNIYVGQTLYVPMPEPAEQKVEDLRGYLSISVHNKSDGTSSKEYNLEVAQGSGGTSLYTMEGSLLSELDAYNGLPVLVTGTINISGKLVVDSYRLPYPDLHFQILKGTQKSEQIGGQTAVVFTAEHGQSYVEFLVTNNIPNDSSFTGQQGDLIQQEVLIIPDERFGGMPVAHIYQSAIVQEGGPEMEPRGNRIYVINEGDNPMMSPDYAPPNLTINQVELVYYASNPYYQVNDPSYAQRSPYLQPAWHFQGQYEDGTQFDVLVQALKQEFLLPEVAPHPGPG